MHAVVNINLGVQPLCGGFHHLACTTITMKYYVFVLSQIEYNAVVTNGSIIAQERAVFRLALGQF